MKSLPLTVRVKKINSLQTNRGKISAKKIALAVAGNTSRLWDLANLGNLPIESHKLQAFVTEPLKPLLDQVVVFGVGGAHFYISQSDKGAWYLVVTSIGINPMLKEGIYQSCKT